MAENPVLDEQAVESVRESIQKARTEVSQKVEAPKAETPEKPAKDVSAAAHKSPKQEQRERDEQGKFAPKQEKIEKEFSQIQAGAKVANPADKPEPIKPPDTWGARSGNETRMKVWAKLASNPEAKDILDALVEREKEVHLGFTKIDEDRHFAKKVKDAITPYLPMIRAEGGDEVRAVQSLLQTAYTLRTSSPQQRAQLYAQLFQQFPADFSVFEGGQQPDPRYNALQQQLQQESFARQQLQASIEAQQLAQAQQVVEAFSKDKPFFDQLKPLMKELVDKGLASTIEDAYEKAAWQSPEVRSSLIQQEKERAAKDQAEKVAAKKAVAVSVKGSPGGETQAPDEKPKPGESVRETIARTRRQLSSAA